MEANGRLMTYRIIPVFVAKTRFPHRSGAVRQSPEFEDYNGAENFGVDQIERFEWDSFFIRKVWVRTAPLNQRLSFPVPNTPAF